MQRNLNARLVERYSKNILNQFKNSSVNSMTVTDGGSGYSVGDSVVINGDGVGATAEVGSETSGVIDIITITAAGSGYTVATVDCSGSGNGDATATAAVSLDLLNDLTSFDEHADQQNERLNQVLVNALISLALKPEQAAVVQSVIDGL
ncbi:hypothetical protein [Teredinibacter haidensis]|uniref:hypothetical protein n=1 Tax=Teredinibacter haidensis TaxID=2731755 RepID=UPI000949162F|nr:hypothetical protein [Teredinibacter haidensis]